jgi:hypothetical protein
MIKPSNIASFHVTTKFHSIYSLKMTILSFLFNHKQTSLNDIYTVHLSVPDTSGISPQYIKRSRAKYKIGLVFRIPVLFEYIIFAAFPVETGHALSLPYHDNHL